MAENFQIITDPNGEEALWPPERAIPVGWSATGRKGPREDLLRYLKELWTDPRPLSPRDHVVVEDAAGQLTVQHKNEPVPTGSTIVHKGTRDACRLYVALRS